MCQKIHDTGVGPTAFENLLCIYGECIVNGGDDFLSRRKGGQFSYVEQHLIKLL